MEHILISLSAEEVETVAKLAPILAVRLRAFSAEPFADYVREARQAGGLSQTRLAEEVGRSRVFISQIETGATTASDADRARLVAALEANRA